MGVSSRYKPTTLHMPEAYGVVATCIQGIKVPAEGDNSIAF